MNSPIQANVRLCFPGLSILALLSIFGTQAAAATVTLGTAVPFAVLGATTVTITGPTTLNGDLGLWPGTSITGEGNLTLIGSSVVHNDDIQAQNAQADALTAYNELVALPFTTNLSGTDLGGLTLTPGVYYFSSSAQLTGTLTLDAQNNPNALFVFQIGSTLTTASNANVTVINGDASTGVYFQVGSSATLGTGTTFAGNVIALTSITLTTNVSVICGRAIALNAAVTMDTNVVSNSCNAFDNSTGRVDFGSNGFVGAPSAVPEPASILMSAAGLLLIGKRFFRT
ncbi:ice-binding family protein [Bryobacter aggregatus]|uniref:ice-binding family protein n=1 Tax=Bryobacter aggregatus TaxID=360054 RepID=UPI00068DF656|nr:ice-binding family protein [Bryobacter aggregatus]